jgi:hypothetical protein
MARRQDVFRWSLFTITAEIKDEQRKTATDRYTRRVIVLLSNTQDARPTSCGLSPPCNDPTATTTTNRGPCAYCVGKLCTEKEQAAEDCVFFSSSWVVMKDNQKILMMMMLYSFEIRGKRESRHDTAPSVGEVHRVDAW